MLPNMLIATGYTEDAQFEEKFPDIQFTVVQEIYKALEELKENPTKYNYIMISASSFAVSGGMNIDDTMQALAEVLQTCTYDRFLLLDVKKQLEVPFNKYMMEVRKRIKVNCDGTLRLRTYYTAIKQLLETTNQAKSKQEEQPPQPQPKPEKQPKSAPEPKPKKEKKPLFQRKEKPPKISDAFDKIKKSKEKPSEPIQEQTVPSTPPPPVQQPPKPKQRKFSYDKFKRNSLLFTSPSSKTGTTMVSMGTAHLLASKGLNVCYIQVTDKLFTCNTFITENEMIRGEIEDPFTGILPNLVAGVSVYKNMHIITNTLYQTESISQSHINNIVAKSCQSFDTVVLDIDFDIMCQYPHILNMFKYYVMVLTNTVNCVTECAYNLSQLYETEAMSVALALTTLSNVVINNVSDYYDAEGKPLSQEDVMSQIVDIDDQLDNVEFLNIAGYIAHNSKAYNNPFTKAFQESLQPIIEELK